MFSRSLMKTRFDSCSCLAAFTAPCLITPLYETRLNRSARLLHTLIYLFIRITICILSDCANPTAAMFSNVMKKRSKLWTASWLGLGTIFGHRRVNIDTSFPLSIDAGWHLNAKLTTDTQSTCLERQCPQRCKDLHASAWIS